MDENDPELVQRALGSPFIRSMDVEYARLAASIPIPHGDRDAMHAPGVRMGAELPYVSQNARQGQSAVDHVRCIHLCWLGYFGLIPSGCQIFKSFQCTRNFARTNFSKKEENSFIVQYIKLRYEIFVIYCPRLQSSQPEMTHLYQIDDNHFGH